MCLSMLNRKLQSILLLFFHVILSNVFVAVSRALANSFTPASVFVSRQFWSSVKLLDNMSKWQGLLSDRPLQALALDALLTRYTILGIRVASELSESVERAKGVTIFFCIWIC